MKKIALALSVILVAVFTSFKPIDAGTWAAFKPEGSRCSVLMPGKPEPKQQVVNTAIGELTINLFMYQPESGADENLIYGLSYTDYPAELITSDSTSKLKNFFDMSRDGAIKNIQGKLLSETIIKYKQYPGREQRVDFKNGMAIIKYRHYFVKNRMYTLQVITLTDKSFNKSVNKFMDSFELTQ